MWVSTGVPGLNSIVEGGLPKNRLYVVSGPPGSGNTTFCSHFITAGARAGESCLYVTMHETKAELIEDMAGYSFAFDLAIQSGAVRFLNRVIDEGLDEIHRDGTQRGLTGRLTGLIEETEVDRVVDSTLLLEHFLDDSGGETAAFLTALKQVEATVILISETDPTSYAEEHYLAHMVIFFHNFLEDGGMDGGSGSSRCARRQSMRISARSTSRRPAWRWPPIKNSPFEPLRTNVFHRLVFDVLGGGRRAGLPHWSGRTTG